jgi:uncharacterized protein YjbI with pentapeptide repeats
MEENQKDKREIKLTATEDIKRWLEQINRTRIPERKGNNKQVNSPAKFFKKWTTPITTIAATIIAVGGLIWGVYQFNTQQAINQAQVLDQQHETTLDTYYDRISDLIFLDGLVTSKTGAEVRQLAAARTGNALRNLDGMRKGYLIKFLWRAELINSSQPIVPAIGVDLSGAIFIHTNLSRINLVDDNLENAKFLDGVSLYGANLSSVDLRGANLIGANLAYADLLNANLNGTNLRGANLYGAYLSGSNIFQTVQVASRYRYAHFNTSLSGADLRNASLAGAYLYNINLDYTNFSGAQLQNAELSYVNLHDANLVRANFSGSDLSNANLSGADLKGVNLKNADLLSATVTAEQLKEAESLKGAIMPNGSIHP